MTKPADATATAAWADLLELKQNLRPDLRAWFADEPARARDFSFQLADLHLDLSKNLINHDVVAALLRLAEQVDVAGARDAMYRGDHINVTEDRAVLHTALRRPEGASPALVVDGQWHFDAPSAVVGRVQLPDTGSPEHYR